jgi:separase
MVDRVTYLGTCELLASPPSISLGSASGESVKPVLGYLLERQLDSLESSRHKEEARQTLGHLLLDALKAYTTETMPLRRARILTRCLEFMYHVDGVPVLREVVGRAEEVAQEIQDLLDSKVCPAVYSLFTFAHSPQELGSG